MKGDKKRNGKETQVFMLARLFLQSMLAHLGSWFRSVRVFKCAEHDRVSMCSPMCTCVFLGK